MHDKKREVMLLAAYHIEREAESLKDCCTMDDGIAWDYEGDLHEYEQAMSIVSALRREAGVTEEAEPEVITPIGPEVTCYDPAKIVPEPLHTVLVVWRPLYDEDVLDVDKAYRCPDGKWVLDDDLSYTAIEPLAWTPKPRIPKWVEDKR